MGVDANMEPLLDIFNNRFLGTPEERLRIIAERVWDNAQQEESEAHFIDAGYGNVQHPENPYRRNSK